MLGHNAQRRAQLYRDKCSLSGLYPVYQGRNQGVLLRNAHKPVQHKLCYEGAQSAGSLRRHKCYLLAGVHGGLPVPRNLARQKEESRMCSDLVCVPPALLYRRGACRVYHRNVRRRAVRLAQRYAIRLPRIYLRLSCRKRSGVYHHPPDFVQGLYKALEIGNSHRGYGAYGNRAYGRLQLRCFRLQQLRSCRG